MFENRRPKKHRNAQKRKSEKGRSRHPTCKVTVHRRAMNTEIPTEKRQKEKRRRQDPHLQSDGAQKRNEHNLAHSIHIGRVVVGAGVDRVVGQEKADGGIHYRQQHPIAPEGDRRQAALLIVALCASLPVRAWPPLGESWRGAAQYEECSTQAIPFYVPCMIF